MSIAFILYLIASVVIVIVTIFYRAIKRINQRHRELRDAVDKFYEIMEEYNFLMYSHDIRRHTDNLYPNITSIGAMATELSGEIRAMKEDIEKLKLVHICKKVNKKKSEVGDSLPESE